MTQLTLNDLLAKFPTYSTSTKKPGLRLKMGYDDVRLVLSSCGKFADVKGVRGPSASRVYAKIDLATGEVCSAPTGRTHNPIQGANQTRNLKILAAVWSDPIAFCDAHGKIHNFCCFCGCNLTHQNSTERGYGPECAKKYALPYG